jgi:predicted nucleotidyltransferase
MSFGKLKQKWSKDKKARRATSADLKHLLLARGRPIFKKYGITKVVLFGSVADGRCDMTSDIDILVQPLPGKKYWNFRREIEDAMDSPVDLYTTGDDSTFVKKILSRGKTVYEVQS